MALEMNDVTESYARRNLAKLMDEVERNHVPVTISRQNQRGAAVLMSLDDYRAIETTLYLLGNPANAKLLLDGIVQLNAGNGVRHDRLPVQRRASRA